MSTGDDPRPLRFAVVGLDHSHAFGQTTGLLGQGCELVGLSSDDPDAAVARAARGRWPDAPWVADSSELLHDPTIDLIVTAAVPDRRGPIAVAALRAGKDVVTDKPGCVSFDQLEEIEKAVGQSGRFWSVTFSERFEVPSVIKAGELVREGRIGTVVQTLGIGPHRVGDRGHLGGGAGRPGLVLRQQPVRRHPDRHRLATRSTSSSGSPAHGPPRSWPARSGTSPTPRAGPAGLR